MYKIGYLNIFEVICWVDNEVEKDSNIQIIYLWFLGRCLGG